MPKSLRRDSSNKRKKSKGSTRRVQHSQIRNAQSWIWCSWWRSRRASRGNGAQLEFRFMCNIASDVFIVPPTAADCETFLEAVTCSRELHAAWVSPPRTCEEFNAYLDRLTGEDRKGFLVRHRESSSIVGVADLSSIVRGVFCSCFL